MPVKHRRDQSHKEKKQSLGRYPDVTLKGARELCAEALIKGAVVGYRGPSGSLSAQNFTPTVAPYVAGSRPMPNDQRPATVKACVVVRSSRRLRP